MPGEFTRFLIGDRATPVPQNDLHQNIALSQSKPRIMTPIGIEFNAGEFSPVVSWELRDANGKLVDRAAKKADSFLANFIKILHCQMSNDTFFHLRKSVSAVRAKLLIRDTSGVYFIPRACSNNLNAAATIGDATLGLIVGTDNTPTAFDDYVLGALIAHGVGAGQLQYGVTSYGLPTSDGTTSQFRFTRIMSNGSGAAINVNEAGIVGYCLRGYNELFGAVTYGITQSLKILLLRDILPGAPVAVPNGNSLTVNYQPQATV